MLAQLALGVGIQAHERGGAVRQAAGAAEPGAGIVVAEAHLAAARVGGVGVALAGGELEAGQDVARGGRDVGVAAVVHDGVGVAAGEFLE